MKLIKYVSMLALSVVLVGCGGHGYEGEYESKIDSSNELFEAFGDLAGTQKIVIGSDYVESQGQRQVFDDIFVRQSGSDKYLVFKDANSEEGWKILDEDTLLQGNSFMNVTLVRVK